MRVPRDYQINEPALSLGDMLKGNKIELSKISNKSVEIDFDGGRITSDAGALFIREVESQTGIMKAIAGCIEDKRDQRYVRQEMETVIRQRVTQISCGYEDANDCNTLRNDPAIKMAAERDPVSGDPLASQPTVSRVENSISRKDLVRIGYALADHFIASYEKEPQIIVLDFDNTEDAVHGAQQLSLFNAYYDGYCYQPLHVYEGLSGKLITTILRPGKRTTSKEVVAVLKRLIPRLRLVWKDTIIMFRGDSHFSGPETLQWLEDNDILYVIGQSKNKVLEKLTQEKLEEARKLYKETKQKVRLFDLFEYYAVTYSDPHYGTGTKTLIPYYYYYTVEAYKNVNFGQGSSEPYICTGVVNITALPLLDQEGSVTELRVSGDLVFQDHGFTIPKEVFLRNVEDGLEISDSLSDPWEYTVNLSSTTWKGSYVLIPDVENPDWGSRKVDMKCLGQRTINTAAGAFSSIMVESEYDNSTDQYVLDVYKRKAQEYFVPGLGLVHSYYLSYYYDKSVTTSWAYAEYRLTIDLAGYHIPQPDGTFLEGGQCLGMPPAPTMLAAHVVSNSQIDLSWEYKSNFEIPFDIHRAMGEDETFEKIATIAAGTTNYSDTHLLPNTKYSYKIYAYNKRGIHNYYNTSNHVQATTNP